MHFDGIASATWDGGDGLSAAFDPAYGAPPLVYTLTVTDDAGAVVTKTGSHSPLTVTGLADGIYTLSVSVVDSFGRTAGAEKSIEQLVGANRVVYRGEAGLDGGARAVSGDGDLIAIGGGPDKQGQTEKTGLAAIVDASDVNNPVTLSTITGLGQVTDVEIHDGLLFVATDTVQDSSATTGVWIYDIADPTAPVLVSTIEKTEDIAHTLSWGTIAGQDLLLLASNQQSGGRIAFYSFADPANPALAGYWSPPPSPQGSGVHDQILIDQPCVRGSAATGACLYSAYTEGFGIVDVSDLANPLTLVAQDATWSNPFVHNLGLTDDGLTMAMSEEAVGGGLRVWDLSNLDAPVQAAEYITAPTHSIHNVAVRGSTAFCAWYVDGLLALDLSDPANPTLVGSYDTYAGADTVEERSDGTEWPNVAGATNVWVGGPHIAVSDSVRGLILFDFYAVTVAG